MGTFYKTNKIFVSKTLTKMIISYFIIILISISTISFILYFKFSSATIEDIRINMQDKLTQNMNQLEFVKNQVNALGLQLINDSILLDSMYENDPDLIANYLSTRKLIQVRDAYPMIQSVYIYNAKNQQLVSNFGSSINPTHSIMESLVKNSHNLDYFQFIPLSYTYRTKRGDQATESILSFVFSDTSQVSPQNAKEDNRPLDSSVIINLKADYIQKFFAESAFASQSETWLVNKAGDVICSSDSENFGINIINKEYIGTILKANNKSGYMIIKDGKDQSLITYYASDTIPYLFINKSNYAMLLEKIYVLRATIIIICILIFLGCIILGILSAYNVYLPFGKLVKYIKWQLPTESGMKTDIRTFNEVEYLTKTFSNIISKSNELETSMQENIPLLKNMYLKGLLEGNSKFSNNVSSKIPDLNFNRHSEGFCVLLFSIDGYSKISRLESDLMKYNVKSKIENIVSGGISDAFKTETVDLEEDFIAVIAKVDNEGKQFMPAISGRLNEIQCRAREETGFSVTAVIGLTVERFENIHLSYSNCLELLKYRFVYGYGFILDNNRIQTSVNKKYTSIEKEKKEILQAIKGCDKKQMEIKVNRIITSISDNQYDYIKLTINQLTLDTMKTVECLLSSEDNEVDFNNLYSNLNNMDTLEDVRAWFILYCNSIIQKLENKKDNKHKDMVIMALEYLKTNYYKPELSTELLSEIVNLTPGYFGKIFNEYMKKSVNEYIIELRMEKAKQLLIHNGYSINDIAANVGYTNQSYFTSIFKRYCGLTPNQYRIEVKKTNN